MSLLDRLPFRSKHFGYYWIWVDRRGPYVYYGRTFLHLLWNILRGWRRSLYKMGRGNEGP